MIYAKVIKDSLNEWGNRLTTIEVNYHRFIHGEVMTHRLFSRNSASSRAIPVRKLIDMVRENPAIPIEFGTAKKGMQAGPALEGKDAGMARAIWLDAAGASCIRAEEMLTLGVHKQVVNRILEPFLWHRVIISATEWDNFFQQRRSPLAQPEIHRLADCIYDAMNASTPSKMRKSKTFPYHLPYIDKEDEKALNIHDCIKVSVARCARVSYLNHDGKRDYEADIALFDKLRTANPPHWSPMEHIARPCRDQSGPSVKNFRGWIQLRYDLEPANA